MSNTAKTNFLARHKWFLITISFLYTIGVVLGLYLFHSPNFSKEYLRKYEHEHKIYKEIIKNPEFHKFLERPHLFKGVPEELEKFQFAQEYEETPEFQREKQRIFCYVLWFKLLNFITLFICLFHFGWKPLLEYISDYQRTILSKHNELDKRIKEVSKELKEAEATYQTLPTLLKEQEYYKESFINQRLSDIEKQNQQAIEQIKFLLETKKQEEILICINEVKKKIIEEAIKKAEQEIIATETEERLAETVERFNFLITMIS